MVRIVYLDQNQWIKLARAIKSDKRNDPLVGLLNDLRAAIGSGSVIVPLTAANLYETFKINSPDRRRRLAELQASLSQGWVFRARKERWTIELKDFLGRIYGPGPVVSDPARFISRRFIDAFPQYLEHALPEQVEGLLCTRPAFCVFDYLMSANATERQQAVRNWSSGAAALLARIERRRCSWRNDKIADRKRAYCASLLIDEIDEILEIAEKLGAPWKSVSDIGSSNVRRLIKELPAFDVETELAVKLETLAREVTENDTRDLQSFCAAVPYADCVVAETVFTNLARQAGLGRKYGTELSTDVRVIRKYL